MFKFSPQIRVEHPQVLVQHRQVQKRQPNDRKSNNDKSNIIVHSTAHTWQLNDTLIISAQILNLATVTPGSADPEAHSMPPPIDSAKRMTYKITFQVNI